MKKHLMLASAIACACTLSGSSAGAQSHETVTTTGPNRELLHGGILALGVPYVASVVVAATSDRPEDKPAPGWISRTVAGAEMPGSPRATRRPPLFPQTVKLTA
jgi:hypothetical protein